VAVCCPFPGLFLLLAGVDVVAAPTLRKGIAFAPAAAGVMPVTGLV
jgi:hypothetical protein